VPGLQNIDIDFFNLHNECQWVRNLDLKNLPFDKCQTFLIEEDLIGMAVLRAIPPG